MTSLLCFFFSGKRRNPSDNVSVVRGFVGKELFKSSRWHVAHGDHPSYEEGGAFNITECGTTSDAINHGLDLGRSKKLPVLFIADDVSAVMELDTAAPERWKDSGGMRLQARVTAHKVLTRMRAVGAMIGGVAPLE